MLEMVGRAQSANGINTELVMRDKPTVALRKKMKMKSLHESEEYKHSLNSRATKDVEKEGEKLRSTSESSDEIYLDLEEKEEEEEEEEEVAKQHCILFVSNRFWNGREETGDWARS